MKTRFLILSALILALCLTALPVAAETSYGLGEPMADFSASTIDGGVFTLSEVLEEKDLVLINLWATWCGPCRMEFPFMEQAWQRYRDRVAIIALSVEPDDTVEVLKDFAAQNGLTFSIAREENLGFGRRYAAQGIPTTLLVDRFGNLVYREVGAKTSAEDFTSLFDYYLREGYASSEVLEGLPPALPSVQPTNEAELAAAANADGSALAFRNPESPYVWPMLVEEENGGRSCLVSSNWGQERSVCAAFASVDAAEGDALAFEFFTSTEASCDLLTVAVDGEIAKRFGGEHGWTEWAIPLAQGPHEIEFSYRKDVLLGAGDDLVRIDNVRLVSGEEAAAALAALPTYPVADEFTLTVANADAREIVFDNAMSDYFASQSCWIVPSGEVRAVATLTADIDPEAAFFYDNYAGAQIVLAEALTEEGVYAASTPINSMGATGFPYSTLHVYPSIDATLEECRGVMLFTDEYNVNELVKLMAASGLPTDWRYADGSLPGEAEAAGQPDGFTVTFVDQNGAPVPGCIINFCTDDACVPIIADENGVATFAGEAVEYHLQVIRVPAGYEFDTSQEFSAVGPGCALSFTVTKNF